MNHHPENLAEARERRGLTIPILAVATGVAQHVLEAAETDPSALDENERHRVAVVLGVDRRVLEVPAAGTTHSPQRVLEAARRIVAHDERDRVHDPEAPWVAQARRAGVDVEQSFGVGRAA